MSRLDRYTPEICSQLKTIAEKRDWRNWDRSVHWENLMEDLELTYHLHVAAAVSGTRAGLPQMPNSLIDSEGLLDPAEFLRGYFNGRHRMTLLNH